MAARLERVGLVLAHVAQRVVHMAVRRLVRPHRQQQVAHFRPLLQFQQLP